MKIGEIRKGCEIGRGKHDHHNYQWLACVRCAKERWVELRNGKPRVSFCNPCVNERQRESNTHSNVVCANCGKPWRGPGSPAYCPDYGKLAYPISCRIK